ncbi:PLP-dependent aminotransferase family protein [Paremcibacter congregatus]|uniref:HTH gntR-type domain-containing protein n=1 Tax=Paremcibacter congregatus TaxID=2043170 RepID=A0A2G4YWF7_9PROT|nr:PLP-dependent aminotransferase family protein [Paremcibacter congregatus]PHZ86649.1 hypothetical protein CRD36_01885 [Paremcibacter congregatus]QDE26450.1 PLP-dependent aminotransferase family protein [Paremcibacter congregatus]
MTSLHITLRRDHTETLQAQLIRYLKQHIRQRQIAQNQRLPSSRALARDLQVSRIVTLAAYEQLIAEGYLITRPGAGTYCATDIPPESPAPLAYHGPDWFTPPPAPTTPPDVDINFMLGRPAGTRFDDAAWKRAWRRALAQPFHNQPPPPEGILPLRQALADHMARSRGIRCQAQDIVITTGAADVINLLARVTAPFQPQCCLENPGFIAAHQTFTRYGHDIRLLNIDHDGLRTVDLPETPGRAKVLFCTPSHQFPVGFRLSLDRRHQVMDWARRHDALILEDDYDSEFRHDVAPLPPLKELDQTGHVLYFSSLSKSLSPAIRIGYMIAPATIRQAVAREIDQNHMQPTWLLQQAMAHYIEKGDLDKHLRRMRRHYGKLHKTMKSGLSGLPEGIKIHGLDAGLHCCLELPAHNRDHLHQELIRRGVYITGLDRYYQGPPPWQGYALGYSHLTSEEITRGCDALCQVLKILRVQGRL